MRTWRWAAVCAVALVVIPAGELSAHGMSVVVERQGDVWVATARYDGGIPVAGGDVVIQAPGQEAVYQTGRTDPAGRFAFMPAEPGEWRVQVDDGMGHRRTVRVLVEAEAAMPVESAGAGLADRRVGAGEEPSPEAGGAEAGAPTSPGEEPESSDRRAPALGGGDTGFWRLATGLSLLFGLTGLAYGYTARAREK